MARVTTNIKTGAFIRYLDSVYHSLKDLQLVVSHTLNALLVRSFLCHPLYTANDYVYNARLDSEIYSQRWIAEITLSAIKRRFGPLSILALVLRVWRTRVDCRRLQPQTSTQIVISTQSSDSTKLVIVDGTTHTPGVECKSVGR